jgi:hypothetical protein
VQAVRRREIEEDGGGGYFESARLKYSKGIRSKARPWSVTWEGGHVRPDWDVPLNMGGGKWRESTCRYRKTQTRTYSGYLAYCTGGSKTQTISLTHSLDTSLPYITQNGRYTVLYSINAVRPGLG